MYMYIYCRYIGNSPLYWKVQLRPRSSPVLLAAILPGAPMTPPPGWAPDPQSSRFLTGVPGPGLVSVVGLARYSWSRDMDPWNMFPGNYKLKHCLFLHNIFIIPPVNPKTLSSSGGGRTSFPTMLALNPGAYLPYIELKI